jgi:glucitol/sorbitol PTS system EIIA component
MIEHFRTVVTQVSDEARELVESGVLILFAEGAPPELAEVSVLPSARRFLWGASRLRSRPSATTPGVRSAKSAMS